MLDRVRDSDGQLLSTVQSYIDDSNQYWKQITRFDKFERLQHFRQPENESWRAFASGQWEESIRITLRDRPVVAREFAEDARAGLSSYRVRVAEFPLTPYLQWEMWRFKVRADCGENIRIIGVDAVERFERRRIAPELIFMGDLAMYEILYNEDGVLSGGRKFVDEELVTSCLTEAQALYADAEEFHSFFEREVAPLAPPAIDSNVELSITSDS